MEETKTSRKGAAAALTPPVSAKANSVGMKEAVQTAIAFTKEFFPEAKDIRLEEVEPNQHGWSVVVSFATGEPGTLSMVMGGGTPRLYKSISIASDTGKAQSLKVWKQ